jgi:hypothetical protein
MNDRTKLAEAMGWKEHHGIGNYPRQWRIQGPGYSWCEYSEDDLPNPFTDANDDYAVLEWMRSDAMYVTAAYPKFCDQLYVGLGRGKVWKYEIGFYARAALRVIDE